MFKPPEWEWSQCGDVGWWSRDGWGEVLLGAEGLAPGRVARAGAAHDDQIGAASRGLSRGPATGNRSTSSTSWCRIGEPCSGSGFAAERGGTKGKRSQHLASIGVPTITPIALGERRKRKFLFENYLVTLAISAATPLDEFVERQLPERPEPLRSQIRQKLAEALAVMTARLHDAGLLHQDFHPGNILVRFDGRRSTRALMIDLDALRKSRRVTWKLARQNLALLDHFFWLRSTRTDRYRFLKTYLETGRSRRPTFVGSPAEIEDTTASGRSGSGGDGGGAAGRRTSTLKSIAGGTTWCVASRDLGPAEIQPAPGRSRPAVPASPIDDPLEEFADDDGGRDDDDGAGPPTQVIYKRFNRKKWLDPLLTLFRPSRAWRSWQAGQHLASRGIPTPQNLAFLSRRRPFKSDPLFWFLPHETYLITVKEDERRHPGDLRQRGAAEPAAGGPPRADP